MKHHNIPVFVAREGHCKLSELRRTGGVEGAAGAGVGLWGARRLSAAGVTQAELAQQDLSVCRSASHWREEQAQDWECKPFCRAWSRSRGFCGQQLCRCPKDLACRPACLHCASAFGWYLTSWSFVSLSFYRRKLPSSLLPPDVMFHYLWCLDISFEKNLCSKNS